ncbi:hypothetical protein [Streptomyces sp. NPDC001970]
MTGEMPKANVPLLPPPGPWRNIVKATTDIDPGRRPQTPGDLLALIDREHAEYSEDPLERAEGLLEIANTGDIAAVEAFLGLADDHDQDYELYIDVLTRHAGEYAALALASHSALSQRGVLQRRYRTDGSW